MAFDAFISYAHAADGALAPALRRALQDLARPWYRRRALAVFLDQSSLAAAEDLPASLQRALAASRHFVYLASPEAARSPWVGRELAAWRAAHGGAGLLIALTAGELQWRDDLGDFDPAGSSALHPQLFGAFAHEPLWVDLRWAHDQGTPGGQPAPPLSARDPRFQQATAMLAAPMHGLGLDELVGEDVRAHRLRRRVIAGTTASLLVLLVVAGCAAWLAGRTAIDLQRRQNQLDTVLPFYAQREDQAESEALGPAWSAWREAIANAWPWRRPRETELQWNEQPSWIVVQEDCTLPPVAAEEPPPEGCAPPGTPYGPEGLRSDLPLLPELARQLAADLREGRVADLLGAVPAADAPARSAAPDPAAASSADAGDAEQQSQARDDLDTVQDLASILIPPALAHLAHPVDGPGEGPPRVPIEEAYRTLSLWRYPLQMADTALGQEAELVLLHLSDHRLCGSGQCISPTLVYLRRGTQLDLVWLNTRAGLLTLLDRGAGEMPDILATEFRQSGVAQQFRGLSRYQFMAYGLRYWAHLSGEVRANMPVQSAPIPALPSARASGPSR